jgi:hypothetical protein
MAAFLLSWNPDKFAWEDLRKTIARVQRKGSVTGRWSCGNRTDLPKGSDFFLIRLGPALKGLVGRGVTTSVPFKDTHWDPEKRRQRIRALYVKIRYTDLRETPLIPWDELQRLPLSRFKWSIYASGIALPEVIVEELNRRWYAAKAARSAISIDVGPEVLSPHPFADEWKQDSEILEQAELSPTDKEALIMARRGQGIFRENVLNMEPQCRVTKITTPVHLRASHIKPWIVSSNAERLAANNGLMLAPHVDHLFDRGFISFTDNGDLLVSPECSAGVLAAWGISPTLNVGPFRATQRPFLAYHRAHRFKT